ncbi:MAG: hypothetical protein H7296_02915 [Bacteroidia bacterium]|nr:hypothetical protein [Bacteroidia bacterium]
MTYEKISGESFLVFFKIKKKDEDAADKKIITTFIEKKDHNVKEFQKKVETEKKFLLEE